MKIAPATRALTRLAWRELRRRPGRSLLVIALVALPVAALVVGAALNASSVASPQDQRRIVLGGADVVVQFVHHDAANGDTVAEVLRRLPAGSRAVRERERSALVPVRNRDVFVQVSDLPLDDPLAAGMTKLLRGRVPVGRGEVAASPVVLRDLKLRVGDMLVSRSLGLRARITGEVIDPSDLQRLQVHSGVALPRTSSRTARLLVSLPAGTETSAIKRLRGPGRDVKSVANCCPDERPAVREATLTISGLALFVVGLVVGRRVRRRRSPPTAPARGLATSALGTVLLLLALDDHGPHGLTLVGAVLIVLGFVLCAPAIISVLEPLATRTRGTTRLAAREIARQRARSGPLVAAILAVASLTVLGSTMIGAIRTFGDGAGQIAPNEVLLSTAQPASSQPRDATVSPQLRARVRALLPGATQTQIGVHQRRAADGVPEAASVHRPGSDIQVYGVAIGGPQLLEFLGAGAGRAAFDRGAVIALASGLISDGHVRIAVPQTDGKVREVRAPAIEVHVDRPPASVLVSTPVAARLGLTPTATDVLLRTPNALTEQQRQALQALAISADRSTSPGADTAILHAGNFPRQGLSRGAHEALLALAAALTLAVVASGLALSAAEGRSDDTMLVALGADPATRRRLRATQAAMLVAIAGLLALPAGLIPATAFILQSNEMRFAVPWTAAAFVLLALPAAAAAGAWLLTRPARWSPPATWAD